ncbi:hypothetical protein HY732_03535 [Candidatus Uhrbacteria bacterium]|nr:hypothetical protein [Candidatus Uhrbacteria bacterium]
MGHLIKLKPSAIKPSQDFLKKGTMDFIFDCFKKGELALLPPPPLVRRDPGHMDSYIAIDGHNLLAAHEFFGTECEVFLVDSADDFLPNPNNDPRITQRNKDLSEKFESCVDDANEARSSFQELIQGYNTT